MAGPHRAARFRVTLHGRRFHEDGCTEVDQFKATSGTYLISAQQVRENDLKPCMVCRPVLGLTVAR